MFTGIIESLGEVVSIQKEGSNTCFRISSSIGEELRVDQSVSHNGVCLTVVEVVDKEHVVTAISETLKKTNLGKWKVGDEINLERCMLADGRFDGHIVQGHVDQIGTCKHIEALDGSWEITIGYDAEMGNTTVEKGSICINGISLTCFESKADSFKVAIIPYTYDNTNMNSLVVGDQVNLEFDVIGKYVQKLLGSTLTQ